MRFPDWNTVAWTVGIVLLVQFCVPSLQPTPRVPDVSYRANPNMLQKHVEYFDRNHDGIISVPETFESLNLLGFDWFGNIYRTSVIHGGMYLTYFVKSMPPFGLFSLRFWGHLLTPDFQLRVPIQIIHTLRHPSDSGVYDAHGQFVEERFERLLQFDKGRKGGLDRCQLQSFREANNNPPNAAGKFGADFEWTAAYEIMHDNRGVMSRETLLKMYNGSVWEEIAQAVAAGKVRKNRAQPVEATILTKSA